MMESPIINNPLFNLYFKMVNKFTPNFHRCPMKKHEEIMLRNFTIDFNLIPASFLVLNGHFCLEFTYFSTKLGDKVLYSNRNKKLLTISLTNYIKFAKFTTSSPSSRPNIIRIYATDVSKDENN